VISNFRRKVTLFLQYCRTFGIARSFQFVARRAASRTWVRLANRALPGRFVCPCCDWSGYIFDDYIEVGYRLDNYVCPRCGSHPRHRFFFLWLQRSFGLANKSGVAILFAFERPLAKLWHGAKGLRAIRTDIEPVRGVDVVADIQRLPFPSNFADLIWCHHVLEHVRDDRAAIRELARILRKSTGALILSVPMVEGATTLEHGFPVPTESGHWRRYADDFAERLSEAGLTFEAVRMNSAGAEVQRYGFRPELFFICASIT
jgi:SAM-dependent methyltransferase